MITPGKADVGRAGGDEDDQREAGRGLRDLGLLAEGEATAGLSDEALLGRFLGSRDESAERAFAALVASARADGPGGLPPGPPRPGRRGRRLPGDVPGAGPRAGSVRVGGSLAPWLHGVSVRVARRARAVADRRNARERTNAEAPEVAARDERDRGRPPGRDRRGTAPAPATATARPWSCSTSKG